MFEKILRYIIELAKYDLDYDIRDRARLFDKLIPCHSNSPIHGEGTLYGGVPPDVLGKLFGKGIPQVSSLSKSIRFYLPGSLSHVVLHAAPGYRPLPKPCTMCEEDLNLYSDSVSGANVTAEDIIDGSSFDDRDPENSSGSSFEESGSHYDSEHSNARSISSEGSRFTSESKGNCHTSSLVSKNDNAMPPQLFPDAVVINSQTSQFAVESISASYSSGLAEIMSKSALESWLGEQPSSSSGQKSQPLPSARVAINDLRCTVKSKLHVLLDPANGNGLEVEYSFSSEVSNVSPLLVCLEVFFTNRSTEQLKQISISDGESDGSVEPTSSVLEKPESTEHASEVPTILPVEQVVSLDPGQNTKRVLQIRFLHHLLPVKLSIFCNGKKYSTKLWPEIGYFMRPLLMNLESFANHESRLRGMFEYSKSCTFKDHVDEVDHEKQSSIQADHILIVSRCLASKVLSNANLCLLSTDMPVSFNMEDASGLRLRFSGEILSSSKPCLITLLTEGKCHEPLTVTVKINCEETTFGLNLLNRLVALLN